MMMSQYFGSFGSAFPFMHPLFGLVVLPLAIALAVWTIAIKGYALWHAARNAHKVWFVALLVVNTLGILELVYLIWFRTKKDLGAPEAPVANTASSDGPQS
ncbi:MAG TPA: DUF5652 family protein [Candidatus Paceibacterota bacterium]|nr:DUF5652 family protein [Candidatus Paceibacterota bacterium]